MRGRFTIVIGVTDQLRFAQGQGLPRMATLFGPLHDARYPIASSPPTSSGQALRLRRYAPTLRANGFRQCPAAPAVRSDRWPSASRLRSPPQPFARSPHL